MKVSDLDNLAYVLKNFTNYRKGTVGEESVGRGADWLGVKFLKDVDHQRVAERVLRKNWHNRTAGSAMMDMAQSVEHLLALDLSWDQRKNLGRVLISSLGYADLYYLERYPEDKNTAPYYIFQTNRIVEEPTENATQVASSPCGDILIKIASHDERISPTPFPKWDAPYDRNGNRLLTPSHPCPSELEYVPYIPDDGTPIAWLEALHKLESVPYRINKELLEVALKLDENESTRLYPCEWAEYEDRRKALDAEYIRNNIKELEDKVLDYPVDDLGSAIFITYKNGKRKRQEFTKEDKKKRKHLARFSEDEKEIWSKHWREHYLITQTQERFLARRAQYERDVRKAIQLKDYERFYQRASVDYRGRFNLPDFSYQSSDFCRAVIEFADGDYVTDDGWWHLMRHCANHVGKSGDIDAKSKEALGEASLYMMIADDPIGSIKDIKEADKPLCFLRSCMEVRDVATLRFKRHRDKNPDDPIKPPKEVTEFIDKLIDRMDDMELIVSPEGDTEFVSHLPIEIDQSSSAYQHVAGMMDDDNLRERAISAESIYLGVADLLQIEPVNGVEPSTGERKKIIKTIAMAWGYGASDRTCRDRLLKYRSEVEHSTPYLASLTDEEIRDLAMQVIALLKKEFKVCVEYTEEVKKAVDSVLASGREFIAWFTPSMFIVIQRIHTSKTVKEWVYAGNEGNKAYQDVRLNEIRPSPSIHKGDMKTSTPPNLVHSYDATLIHGILWAGIWDAVQHQDTLPYMMPHGNQANDWLTKPDEIIYPIITIHDAFSCHASNMEDLRIKLVNGMGALYTGFDPMKQFLAQTIGQDFSPRNINFEWVNRGRNTFS